MKSSLIKNIILLFLATVSVSGLFAQDDCVLVLKKVTKDFEEGIIEKIPAELSDCADNGLKGKDRIAAYKLLIDVYLFDDRVELAEETMEKLLVFEPEMKPNELLDSKEFTTLFDSYRTIPLFSVGITAGINYSSITVDKEFGTYNTDLYDGIYTAPDFGFQVGLNADYLIYKNLYVNIEALFANKKFSYKTELNTFSTLEFKESESTLQVPLTISYHIGKGRIKPTFKAGAYANYNFSTKSEFIRAYTENTQANITGPLIDVSPMRESITYGLIGGLGVKYKVKEAYWFLDAAYSYTLASSVNPLERYSNSELLYDYQYVDDDFSMNNIFISIGYRRLFYKPKKMKTRE
ncbi:PorT family protein [Vicingaceae bacterium]|nr:PorT family protein [Vicingaceae bacterium]